MDELRNPESTGEAAQELAISVEKMVYGGEGLARTEQGVLLVPLVMPGERVRAVLEGRSKGVRRGRLAEVMEASPDRVAPDCPYFTHCGGCHYQHIRYERQVELKRDVLLECFERIGKLKLALPIEIHSAEPWNYRNRARLRIEKDSSRFEIGYFERLSHKLCAIEKCPISSPAINEIIGRLAKGDGSQLFPEGAAEMELFASDGDRSLLATVFSAQPAPKGFGDALREAFPKLESVCWRQERSAVTSGKPLERPYYWGSGAIAYHVGDYHFRVGHESFFQTNRFLIQELVEVAIGDLTGKRALDLYAGVGLFSLALTRRFEKVAAVEENPAAAKNLESNLGVVGNRARCYHLTAERFLKTATPDWDAIVVDPPRHGLTNPALDDLGRLRVRRLVYVSCDPTTLARDIAALCRSAYRMRSVHLVDQFPQTYHVETVVHLERNE
jgi:23S rRNA (uracil1939-C5)-methyltransferase